MQCRGCRSPSKAPSPDRESSALSKESVELIPPATSTLPEGSNVAVSPARAVVRLPVLPNVNGATAGERLRVELNPGITTSLPPAATGLMGALNPLVAGAALKLAGH